VWHIHSGNVRRRRRPLAIADGDKRAGISFALLLNLAAVANAEDKDVLWGFLNRYAPGVSPETHPRLDALVGYAIRYFRDFVKPKKTYRLADEVRDAALTEALDALGGCRTMRAPEDIQDGVYDVARPIPALSGLSRPRARRRAAGRVERVVQHALPDAARRGARPALRLLRRALWRQGDASADRRRAGGQIRRVTFTRDAPIDPARRAG
jgi:hypothetical protein